MPVEASGLTPRLLRLGSGALPSEPTPADGFLQRIPRSSKSEAPLRHRPCPVIIRSDNTTEFPDEERYPLAHAAEAITVCVKVMG